ncbi:hypothetical protein JCM10213_005748 [Rhodosporidiobolus nylandii]
MDKHKQSLVSVLPYSARIASDDYLQEYHLCAVAGSTGGRVEAAHVVPARDGITDFNFLISAGVVPPFAHYRDPANTLSLASRIHDAFDGRDLHFLPHLELIIHRLSLEYLHFSTVLLLPDPDLTRPPFSAFYESAECTPTLARLIASHTYESPTIPYVTPPPIAKATNCIVPRTTADLFNTELADCTPIPLLKLPISTNLLIYAMARRIRQPAPAPEEVKESSKILAEGAYLLLDFWYLPRDLPTLKSLLDKARRFILDNGKPDSPYFSAIQTQSAYTAKTLPSPSLPSLPPAVRNTFGSYITEADSWEQIYSSVEHALLRAMSASEVDEEEEEDYDDWPPTLDRMCPTAKVSVWRCSLDGALPPPVQASENEEDEQVS